MKLLPPPHTPKPFDYVTLKSGRSGMLLAEIGDGMFYVEGSVFVRRDQIESFTMYCSGCKQWSKYWEVTP